MNKWIKLRDEKPVGGSNILFCDDLNVYAGWMITVKNEEISFWDASEDEVINEGVTHWRKFPELPKGEEND